MKITNEFTVAAPLEETWRTLLDIQRVASCLPGASVEPSDEAGVFKGRMRVKLGAVTTDYSGVARIRELDEDARVAVFDVRGKELRGQGTASAAITNRLSEEGGRTRVAVETDLAITGRPAQFGRGLMADVAGKILEEFAKRLEREITSPAASAAAPSNGGAPAAAAASAPATGEQPTAAAPAGEAPSAEAPAVAASAARPPAESASSADEELEAFDIGGAVWMPVAKRAVPAIAGLGLLGLLIALLTRRTRRPSLSFRIRL
ncbi:MAG TPA: SRPBCC family protein [Conexibacter sp.]|nr:SRPBCC family protein [Conexibacter sp.]